MRAARLLSLGAMLTALVMPGCSDEAPPAEASRTAAEQHRVLVEAAAEAEAERDWPRAQAAYEAILAIEKESGKADEQSRFAASLERVERRRVIATDLDEISQLLEAGAWRTAEMRLNVLVAGELDGFERGEAIRLMTRVRTEEMAR